MLISQDMRLGMSKSPHSLSNWNDVTIPSWADGNPLLIREKAWNGAGMQGMGSMAAIRGGCGKGVGCASSGCTEKCCNGGMNGLSFDGSGLFGTGLFSGDISEWGFSELIFGMIGLYAMYAMFFQAKQTKYRLESVAGRRRKKRASSLRLKAKRLEEQTTGIF